MKSYSPEYDAVKTARYHELCRLALCLKSQFGMEEYDLPASVIDSIKNNEFELPSADVRDDISVLEIIEGVDANFRGDPDLAIDMLAHIAEKGRNELQKRTALDVLHVSGKKISGIFEQVVSTLVDVSDTTPHALDKLFGLAAAGNWAHAPYVLGAIQSSNAKGASELRQVIEERYLAR